MSPKSDVDDAIVYCIGMMKLHVLCSGRISSPAAVYNRGLLNEMDAGLSQSENPPPMMCVVHAVDEYDDLSSDVSFFCECRFL